MDDLRDRFWMERAFAAAREGWGRALPNPCVGAVLVRDGEEIASGFSRPAAAGGAHAEAVALAAAGERARGAALYVTLEPCSHHGRTPPCADAVVRAGVRRVVVGALDPNPLVHGNGARKLREAGVEVSFEGLDGRIEEAYAGFFFRVTRGRPLVDLKLAASADWFAAAPGGRPVRITGDEAALFVHRMRSLSDVVLVSSRTARNDRPRLTDRLSEFPRTRQPARTVLGRDLALRPDDPLFAADGAPVLLFGRRFAPGLAPRAELLPLRSETLAGAFSEALENLSGRGFHRVFVEGGPELSLELLRNGLVDRFFLLQSPLELGEGVSCAGVAEWLEGREFSSFAPLGRDSAKECRLNPIGALRNQQGD